MLFYFFIYDDVVKNILNLQPILHFIGKINFNKWTRGDYTLVNANVVLFYFMAIPLAWAL